MERRESAVHRAFHRLCKNRYMPRLTSTEYLTRRSTLIADQLADASALKTLTSAQRQALRDFYLLNHTLDQEAVLTRQKAASQERPGLVRQAGFAYRAFARQQQAISARQPISDKQPIPSRPSERRIVIHAVERNLPDTRHQTPRRGDRGSDPQTRSRRTTTDRGR